MIRLKDPVSVVNHLMIKTVDSYIKGIHTDTEEDDDMIQ